ncbi:MAG: hypothetical protein ACUVX1_08705 [Chloroflexota bacterium]
MFSEGEVSKRALLDDVLSSRALLAAVALVAAMTFCLGPAGVEYGVSGLVKGFASAVCHVGLPGVGTPPLITLPEFTLILDN